MITLLLDETEGRIIWYSWATCCDTEQRFRGSICDLNLPFIFLLTFAQDKAVLVIFIFFRDCIFLRRDLVVVHWDGFLTHYPPALHGG